MAADSIEWAYWLLLPNLVVLALIALWVLSKFLAEDRASPTAERAEVEQQS